MFLTRTRKKEKIIQSFQFLGWLLASGLPMLDSIQLLCRSFNMLYTTRYPFVFQKYEKYRFLEKLWINIEDGIKDEGKILSECVRGHELIDVDIVERISKGEDNGNLPLVLVQIDRDETDEEEFYSQYYYETSSQIVFIVDDIFKKAINQKGEKIALPSLPNGETVSESETADMEMEGMFPVFFLKQGQWYLLDRIQIDHLPQIINRILLMSTIPYWKKSESERVFKFRGFDVGETEIIAHYTPEPQRIILNITKI